MVESVGGEFPRIYRNTRWLQIPKTVLHTTLPLLGCVWRSDNETNWWSSSIRTFALETTANDGWFVTNTQKIYICMYMYGDAYPGPLLARLGLMRACKRPVLVRTRLWILIEKLSNGDRIMRTHSEISPSLLWILNGVCFARLEANL